MATEQNKTTAMGQQVPTKAALIAMLGEPVFRPGNGRKYPRTEGWGTNKKPHPDGGTNETAAYVIFKPFKGLDVELEGRIYLERFTKDGKAHKRYNISLPFLTVGRSDASGSQAVEACKGTIRERYRAMLSDPNRLQASEPVQDMGSWEDSE